MTEVINGNSNTQVMSHNVLVETGKGLESLSENRE